MANKVFRLCNTRLGRLLTHPATGETMYIASKEVAEDMLRACHEYLEASNLGSIKHEFVVEEVDASQVR